MSILSGNCVNIHGGSLCYDTPITDDVIGYCDAVRVSEILNEIKNLEPK